ncbi:hypothetical protein BCR34DRAFT_669645 [Clohesyomyces aquaticus]|uniref:BTB domain-containing protein n=1 Tax=Clohesyomyces aquaticus TaxID=1231657 RepID=A0A1Y1Y959_9PLEO|nr:hypothetical protein BCR34DRAFT_669645 [Clohesyomyces aquaticus]
MPKKKSTPKRSLDVKPEPLLDEQSTESTTSPQPTDHRPTISPYTSHPVAVTIGPGHRTYYVPQDRLQSIHDVARYSPYGGTVHLPNLDEGTSHVLVHYLYTGAYQTLGDAETVPGQGANIEFRRAISAYKAAYKYGLSGLQELARHELERFSTKLNIFDVVKAIEGDCLTLPYDDARFSEYLNKKAKVAFEQDHTVFARKDLFKHINDVAFAKVMAKCIVRLYNDKISSMLNANECISNAQDSLVEAARPEVCSDIPAVPVEACVLYDQRSPLQEAMVEDCSVPETIPVEDCIPYDQIQHLQEVVVEDCSAIDAVPTEEYIPDDQLSVIEEAQAPMYSTQDHPIEDTSLKEYPVEEEPMEDLSIAEDPVEEPMSQPVAECYMEQPTTEPVTEFYVEESVAEPVEDDPVEQYPVEGYATPATSGEEPVAANWSSGFKLESLNVKPVGRTTVSGEPVPDPASKSYTITEEKEVNSLTFQDALMNSTNKKPCTKPQCRKRPGCI